MNRWPILLLIGVLLAFSFTCAAMGAAPLVPAHPCCPTSGRSAPDGCAKVGCFATVPVLRAEATINAVELPIVTASASAPITESSLFELFGAFDSPHLPSELFLRNSQLLI